MLLTQTHPTVPANQSFENRKPLGSISGLVCSDRMEAIIQSFKKQDSSDRISAYRDVVSEMTDKVDALDVSSLSKLSDRSKQTAVLDIKLLVHAMREIASICRLGGLNNEFQDKCANLLDGALSVKPSQDLAQDPLDITLDDIKATTEKEPRGFTEKMRQELVAVAGRHPSFVAQDIHQYPELLKLIPSLARPQRVVVAIATNTAAPKRQGW